MSTNEFLPLISPNEICQNFEHEFNSLDSIAQKAINDLVELLYNKLRCNIIIAKNDNKKKDIFCIISVEEIMAISNVELVFDYFMAIFYDRLNKAIGEEWLKYLTIQLKGEHLSTNSYIWEPYSFILSAEFDYHTFKYIERGSK